MLKCRPVLHADIQTICAFPRDEEELFYFFPKASFPLTVKQLQRAIDQRSDSTVVEQDGVVVGFANFYHWTHGKCHIGNLIISPDARGNGVAQYLIHSMIDLARTQHAASVVEISCFNQNTSGLLLYQKIGFEPFAIEQRLCPDGRRVALIHMQVQAG